jgi:FtsH-binding integral membrane protein
VFIFFSAVNGLSFSIIFLAYTNESIAQVFVVTSVMFGALALYGFFTGRSLSGIGQLCYTGLIGMIFISILNLFMGSDALYWALSVVGVLIFSGFTAYDTQRLREYAAVTAPSIGGESGQKAAVYGALRVYLDFINLFLFLLRLLGRRR